MIQTKRKDIFEAPVPLFSRKNSNGKEEEKTKKDWESLE